MERARLGGLAEGLVREGEVTRREQRAVLVAERTECADAVVVERARAQAIGREVAEHERRVGRAPAVSERVGDADRLLGPRRRRGLLAGVGGHHRGADQRLDAGGRRGLAGRQRLLEPAAAFVEAAAQVPEPPQRPCQPL